jgi:hypothetical protein
MGMFDDIRVDYPIEGVAPFDDQTKQLECYCHAVHTLREFEAEGNK